MWTCVISNTQCQPRRKQLGQPCFTALHVIDEAIKRYIKSHHVHIDSLLAYFSLNYVPNSSKPRGLDQKYHLIYISATPSPIMEHWLVNNFWIAPKMFMMTVGYN